LGLRHKEENSRRQHSVGKEADEKVDKDQWSDEEDKDEGDDPERSKI
jgi:hypothetical protein